MTTRYNKKITGSSESIPEVPILPDDKSFEGL